MVRKFLGAFFLSRPPRRIVKFIWSVAAVLDMLREWCPVRDLGRPKLLLGYVTRLASDRSLCILMKIICFCEELLVASFLLSE